MIELLQTTDARRLFEQLPDRLRIATLSPEYVFADASRSTDLEPIFLSYRESESFWLQGLHRSHVPGAALFDLQSPYGYGGPLGSTDDRAFISRAWAAYTDWCREANVVAEFIRFHPVAANWRFYGGEVRDDRSTVGIAVEQGIDLLNSYTTRSRTAIRKAQASGIKPVWLPVSGQIERFGNFYRNAMTVRGADSFYMFDDRYLSELAKVPGIRLLVCFLDEEWVSAGLFMFGATTFEYHLSATTVAGRKLGATNLLIHEAAALAQSEGREWLYLGGGTDRREDNSLFFFKSGFSEHRLPFRIGFAVHDPKAYDGLRKAHNDSHEDLSRILFYR